MKRIISIILVLLALLGLAACSGEEYEVIAGQKQGIKTGQTPAEMILGSWYFVGEEDHFMEFYEDGTAMCKFVPEIEYRYTFNGSVLTLTTPDFTRTYDCTISEDGYLTYTWDDKGTPVTEICEKR